jgi:DNA polymerase-3 subunit epsilon
MIRIFFDTETTGLNDDDEIVELAITDGQGNALYSQRFKPTQSMSSGASRVTGITDDMLADMPAFADEFDKIKTVFAQGDQVIAYNTEFDIRLLCQTCEKYDLSTEWIYHMPTRCAMLMYSNYVYDWYDPEIKSKRYKLTDACERMQVRVQNAHSAVGDCIMTANLVRAMETSSDSSQTDENQEGQD